MKNILLVLFLFICYSVSGQVINKIPQYGFQNHLSVGRTSDNDTIAYFQVGPNSGGNKGIILPRVANTSALVGTPKKGLIIYDDSKDSLGYYNGAQWIYLGGGGDTAIVDQGATHIETTGFYEITDSVNSVVCQYGDDVTSLVLPDPTTAGNREITIRNISGNNVNLNYDLKYSTSVSLNYIINDRWVRIKPDGTDWVVIQDNSSTTTSVSGSGALKGTIF